MFQLSTEIFERLIEADQNPWSQRPISNQLIQMLDLTEKLDDLDSQSFEFRLSTPFHSERLNCWVEHYSNFRKLYNQTSVDEYENMLKSANSRLENLVPHIFPRSVQLLNYYYEKLQVQHLKDVLSLKVRTATLPDWKTVTANRTLISDIVEWSDEGRL